MGHALELITLDGLEEGAEVALTETSRAEALDDFVEERAGGRVIVEQSAFDHEDLQKVSIILAIDQDSEAFELFEGSLRLIHATNEVQVARIVTDRIKQRPDFDQS